MRRKRKTPYLIKDRTRHGRVVYYYRKPGCKKVRLPDEFGTEAFWAAYGTVAAGGSYDRPIEPPRARHSPMKLAISLAVRRGLKGAKRRAREKGRIFDLTEDWVLDKIDRQNFRCALTNIPFFDKHEAIAQSNPFSPSIDRIDCRGGYTTDNVRIVIFAMNMMLSDWGEDIFDQVAAGYASTRLKQLAPMTPSPARTIREASHG